MCCEMLQDPVCCFRRRSQRAQIHRICKILYMKRNWSMYESRWKYKEKIQRIRRVFRNVSSVFKDSLFRERPSAPCRYSFGMRCRILRWLSSRRRSAGPHIFFFDLFQRLLAGGFQIPAFGIFQFNDDSPGRWILFSPECPL